MISRSAEYALRALVWLADRPDRPLSTAAIAAGTRVPAGYLSKVLQDLARAGLVRSTPGRTGGFRLTKPAAEMTILEVVDAVDPIERIRVCPLGLRRHRTLCPLHRRLDEVAARTVEAFRETTIAELVDPTGVDRPLCSPKRG